MIFISAVIFGSSGISAPAGVLITTIGRFEDIWPGDKVPEPVRKNSNIMAFFLMEDIKITLKSESLRTSSLKLRRSNVERVEWIEMERRVRKCGSDRQFLCILLSYYFCLLS